MKPEPQEIEVEIVAAEDRVPMRQGTADAASPRGVFPGEEGRTWHSRMRTRRAGCWWPLWVLVGLIAVGAVLLVGLMAAMLRAVVRGVSRMFRA